MHLGAAVTAGLLSGALVAVGLYVAATLYPQRVRLNPFHFLGSAVFVDAGPIYWAGAGMYGALSVVAAVVLLSSHQRFGLWMPLFGWGALFGLVLYTVIGSAAGFVKSLHPAVRTGDVPAPGAFATSQAWPGAVALFLANVGYALLVVVFYSLFL